MPDNNILEMRQIEIQFPGVKALDKVDFSLRAGEIHSLLGENGAGKSTLIKCLTGVHHKDGGTIILNGREIQPQSPQNAIELGISTVYQEVNLCPNLTVAENIFVGRQPMKFGQIDWRTINSRARELMRRFHLDIDVSRPLSYYSTAVQQMVSIARAVDIQAKILILDEPTSSLDDNEVKLLFQVMRDLRAEGMGIIFITHFLDQVYAVSDRLTILRNGHLVGTYNIEDISKVELVTQMVGKDMDTIRKIYQLTLLNPELTLRERYRALISEELMAEWKKQLYDARESEAAKKKTAEIEELFNQDPIRRQQRAQELVSGWKKEYRKML